MSDFVSTELHGQNDFGRDNLHLANLSPTLRRLSRLVYFVAENLPEVLAFSSIVIGEFLIIAEEGEKSFRCRICFDCYTNAAVGLVWDSFPSASSV